MPVNLKVPSAMIVVGFAVKVKVGVGRGVGVGGGGVGVGVGVATVTVTVLEVAGLDVTSPGQTALNCQMPA